MSSKKLGSQGTALVTGASAGIGATYADRLAKRGYDLVLVARDAIRLEALAADLRAHGVKVDVLPADLASAGQRAKVEQRLREDSKITLLVNNAGMSASGMFAEADLDKFDKMIALNILALTRLAGAVLPGFLARGKGTIINLASVMALMPEMPGYAVYSATKAFVLSFSQSLQGETANTGVHVQAVLPGATRTEIWERSGMDISVLPPSMVMEVGELVDAALMGLDRGENFTIPSLRDPALWDGALAARAKLHPEVSRQHPAERYN